MKLSQNRQWLILSHPVKRMVAVRTITQIEIRAMTAYVHFDNEPVVAVECKDAAELAAFENLLANLLHV